MHPYDRLWDWRYGTQEPLRWRKPKMVRLAGDPFDDDTNDEQRDRVFAVMALRPDVTFQILTKRPERMREYLTWTHPSGSDRAEAIGYAVMTLADDLGISSGGIATSLINGGPCSRMKAFGIDGTPWPLPNVWLGVSMENQEQADSRIRELEHTPAAVRFLSCEPLLGPLNLRRLHRVRHRCIGVCSDSYRNRRCPHCVGQGWMFSGGRIDWLITGGESGAKARPCDLSWIRSIVAQCQAAAVSCYVKQLGARPYTSDLNGPAAPWEVLRSVIEPDGTVHYRLRDRHGGDMAEWPPDLRVRQFPEVRP